MNNINSRSWKIPEDSLIHIYERHKDLIEALVSLLDIDLKNYSKY